VTVQNLLRLHEDLEDWQTYWARRGPSIQRLFQNWDSNMLSNEKFTIQLQEILGDRVDISHPESNFLQLTNKHRTARNMKFAALTSALRRDARATEGNEFGEIGTASYAGSAYAASDAGSEAVSYAAGRPTGSKHPQSLGNRGRKHYAPEQGRLLSSSHGSELGDYAQSERSFRGRVQSEDEVSNAGSAVSESSAARVFGAPSGSGHNVSNKGRALRPSTGQRQPPPYACGGNYGGYGGGRLEPIPEPSEAASSGVLPPSQALLRQRQLEQEYWRRPSTADVETASQSDFGGSEADFRRTMHTDRNNRGHGDILSWGSSSSRALTPERKHGRHITVDESGRPQSMATRGIFNN